MTWCDRDVYDSFTNALELDRIRVFCILPIVIAYLVCVSTRRGENVEGDSLHQYHITQYWVMWYWLHACTLGPYGAFTETKLTFWWNFPHFTVTTSEVVNKNATSEFWCSQSRQFRQNADFSDNVRFAFRCYFWGKMVSPNAAPNSIGWVILVVPLPTGLSQWVYPLWPSDAHIWGGQNWVSIGWDNHDNGLLAPSHRQNQCWIFVNFTACYYYT